MSENKKPEQLNKGYQPDLNRGHKPRPISNQIVPPKGGTGQSQPSNKD